MSAGSHQYDMGTSLGREFRKTKGRPLTMVGPIVDDLSQDTDENENL